MQSTSDMCIFELPEWSSVTFDLKGKELSLEDRQLIAELSNECDSRIEIDELRNGLRVRSRSWVGVVRLHQLEIRIVPKLEQKNVALVELIDYAQDIDALKPTSAFATVAAEGVSLFDLIALLLSETCEKILRIGLLSDYCEMEDDLPVLRGRLLMEKQFLKRFGQVDRLECRFDEYRSDILENQVLLAALSCCCNRVEHPRVSTHIRRLFAIFSELCSLRHIDPRVAKSSLNYHRMNAYYREAHELAFVVLNGLGVDDLFTGGDHRSFAFLIDMNTLFQKFMTRWISDITRLRGFRLAAQRSDNTILWNAHKARPYTKVIPDLLLERETHPGVYLPIDAKYKLYDEKTMSTGDIYQTFLYAFAYGEAHAVLPTSLVLYPASTEGERELHVHVRQSGGMKTSAQLRGAAIDIPAALAEARGDRSGQIAGRLLGIIEDVFNRNGDGRRN